MFLSSTITPPSKKRKKIHGDPGKRKAERKSKHVSLQIQGLMPKYGVRFTDAVEAERNCGVALRVLLDRNSFMSLDSRLIRAPPSNQRSVQILWAPYVDTTSGRFKWTNLCPPYAD